MKKKLPIILLGVILACVLVFGFLYANNDIGKTANSLEADIRQSQKILDDWIVDGSISDTMAAFISYPQDKTDHTFSVYVNRPGLSFGYFFRGGGDIVEVDDYIAEFVVEGNNERAFISMNTQNIVRLEVDDGNGMYCFGKAGIIGVFLSYCLPHWEQRYIFQYTQPLEEWFLMQLFTIL